MMKIDAFKALYVPLYSIRKLLFLILLSTAALTPIPTVSQDISLHFEHSERSLQPGEVVRYEIRSPKMLRQLQISAFGRKFPAYPINEGFRWNCLVGIDRDAEASKYPVEITGASTTGGLVLAKDVLVVRHKEFPTRQLTVEPKYVTPPAEVQERIRKERELVDSIFNSTSNKKLWKGPFRAPVAGEVISAFGKKSIYNGEPRSAHSGTDFRGSVGTPIHSPNSGRIVFTGDLYYTGNTVIIDHGLGMYSYLGHMSAIDVKQGQKVETGDVVGRVGATGRVTGPHLHWTVRLCISRVDPISLIHILKPTGSDIE